MPTWSWTRRETDWHDRPPVTTLGTVSTLGVAAIVWATLSAASDGFTGATVWHVGYFMIGALCAAHVSMLVVRAQLRRVLGAEPSSSSPLSRLTAAARGVLPVVFGAVVLAAPVALMWPAAVFLLQRRAAARRRSAQAEDEKQVREIEGAVASQPSRMVK